MNDGNYLGLGVQGFRLPTLKVRDLRLDIAKTILFLDGHYLILRQAPRVIFSIGTSIGPEQ